MNDDLKEKLKFQIAISEMKEKEEIAMERKKMYIKKVIAIAACLFIASGVVLAVNIVNEEKIWKEPKTYEFTSKLTKEEKEQAITEDEARQKASDYLIKIGLEDEVRKLQLVKEPFENEVLWSIGFERGTMYMDGQGNFKSLSIPSFAYEIPEDYGITREEARVVAKELLAKYNPKQNDEDYELVSLKRNASIDEEAYIWYAEFNKKYGDLLNKYECISIAWIPITNDLYQLRIENTPYDNNEQKISKEEAIEIALEKDKKIASKYTIKSYDAEIGIEKMNTEVIYREKNIDEYEKGENNFYADQNGKVHLKDDAEFYEIEDKVRKVWQVKIYYNEEVDHGGDRYVYLVDATTGEIIGGRRMISLSEQMRLIREDEHNVIEK